jgi:hypothetical protein
MYLQRNENSILEAILFLSTVDNLLLLTVEPTREGNLVSMHTKLAREELLRQFQQQQQ